MKSKSIIYSCITTLLFCLAPMSSMATVYKWTDKDGNVHFSQNPRDADSADDEYNLRYKKGPANSEPVTQDTSDNTSGENAKGSDKKVASMEKQKQEASKKAAIAAENIAIKKKNCVQAKERLQSVSVSGRIYEFKEDGKRDYWDDSTRQKKVAEAQGFVDKYCS